MRKYFGLPLTALLFASQSMAALTSPGLKPVPFYLNKQSLFASGQSTRPQLDAALLKTLTLSQYEVLWNDKSITLSSDSLLRDIHTALNVETLTRAQLYSLNSKLSPKMGQLPAGTSLQIIETDAFWAKVFHPQTAKIAWVPLADLRAKHDDIGVYLNFRETPLFTQSKTSSKVIGTLSPLSRVTPLSVSDRFVKLKYNSHIVFAQIENFITKADFATWVYHPEKEWFMITHRHKNFVQKKNGEQVFLAELMGFVTDQKKGIIVKSANTIFEPPVLTKVAIKKYESFIWAQSRLPGHGDVWWKKEDLLGEQIVKTAKPTVTSEELLNREIYSVAFESKKSVRGILSANGVYRTEDGLNWQKIPLFEDKNLPVSIHPDGQWFVGSYVSFDQGKTFESFIRWDKLAETLERTQGKVAKKLRITKIEPKSSSSISLYVDTGSKIVKLSSKIEEQNWR